MKLKINNQFENNDICIAKFEYYNKKNIIIHTQERKLFCEIRLNEKYTNDTLMPNLSKNILNDIVLIVITTFKIVGTKAIV